MLTVVKVGGGLAREAGDGALRALCATVAEAAARHPLLVVPAGRSAPSSSTVSRGIGSPAAGHVR